MSHCLEDPQKWTFSTISFRKINHIQHSVVAKHYSSLEFSKVNSHTTFESIEGANVAGGILKWTVCILKLTICTGFDFRKVFQLQGYLAHKNPTSPQGPPEGPRHEFTVGSEGCIVSHERGTPVAG